MPPKPTLPIFYQLAATVERSFSSIKLVKTRLRSQLGCDTLDQALKVCIEGPERLTDESLEVIYLVAKHKFFTLSFTQYFWQIYNIHLYCINIWGKVILGGKLSCWGETSPVLPPTPPP